MVSAGGGAPSVGLLLLLMLASFFLVAVHRDLALHHPDFLLPTTALYYLVFTLVSRAPRPGAWPTVRRGVTAGSACQRAAVGRPPARAGHNRGWLFWTLYWGLEQAGVHPGGYQPLPPWDMPLDAWRAGLAMVRGGLSVASRRGVVPRWLG